MTNDAQRIAIAEAMGWVLTAAASGWCGEDVWAKNHGIDLKYATLAELPDPLNDLNACHEMEKVILDDPQWAIWLHEVCNAEMYGDRTVCHATAAQRCEAFLRTVGRWEESK